MAPRAFRVLGVVAGAGLALGLLTAATEVDLKQCAAVEHPAARLACYDALAGRAGAPGEAGNAGASAPIPAPAATPAAEPSGTDRFGREDPVKAITAHIVGKFTEWSRGTLIHLDNGQVWKVMDDRAAYYPKLPDNAEVEITRGVLGYSMEIKPIQRRIAVRRVP